MLALSVKHASGSASASSVLDLAYPLVELVTQVSSCYLSLCLVDYVFV